MLCRAFSKSVKGLLCQGKSWTRQRLAVNMVGETWTSPLSDIDSSYEISKRVGRDLERCTAGTCKYDIYIFPGWGSTTCLTQSRFDPMRLSAMPPVIRSEGVLRPG